MDSSSDLTVLLRKANAGDTKASERFHREVYDQLRAIAHARLLHERPDRTISTIGLVSEAYLKLIQIDQIEWHDRNHFFAMASRTMRRILIDEAHRRNAQKRGGGREKVELLDHMLITDQMATQLIDLDTALGRMEDTYPRQSQVIEHRYFGGLSVEETAQLLDVSQETVKRDTRFALAWLARAIGSETTVLRASE